MNVEITPGVLTLAGGLVLLLVLTLWYGARAAQPAPAEAAGPPSGAAAMERKILSIGVMIAGSVLLLMAYGLREPARQVEAQDQLLDIGIGRGVNNFSSLCFSCHGEKGQGAVVPGWEPLRLAPPLDRADLRPTDPDERKKMYDFIFKTISRGRAGTPMPAWNQTDGGALFDEQINDLTLMILNGDRVMEFEGTKGTPWQHVEEVVTRHVAEGLAKMPEQPKVEDLAFYQQLNEQQKQGVRTILQRGCGSCHVIPNIPGAAGTIGPSLAGVASKKQIAGAAVPNNSEADLAKWIFDPPALKPGTAMPKLGLTQDEANAVAAYLYTLK